MMKHRLSWLLVTVPAWTCLALGQNSQAHSSSAKASTEPHPAAIKPLTPKSAMPAHQKSSSAAPRASKARGNTDAELNRLERQNIKTQSPKVGGSRPAKAAQAPKSAGSDSGINFQYQKPKTKNN